MKTSRSKLRDSPESILELRMMLISSNADAISTSVKKTLFGLGLDFPFKNTDRKGDIFCRTTATCIHVPF